MISANQPKNTNDIVAGMRGEIGRRIDSSVFERLPWYEAMLPWARSYLEADG